MILITIVFSEQPSFNPNIVKLDSVIQDKDKRLVLENNPKTAALRPTSNMCHAISSELLDP